MECESLLRASAGETLRACRSSHVDSSRASRAFWQQEVVTLSSKNHQGIHQPYFKYKHYTSDIVRHTGCRPPYWFTSTSGSSRNVSGPLPGSTSAILWKPSWVLTACILYNNVCTFIFSSSLSSSLIYQGQPSIKATHLSRSPQAVATCRSRPTPGEGEGRGGCCGGGGGRRMVTGTSAMIAIRPRERLPRPSQRHYGAVTCCRRRRCEVRMGHCQEADGSGR